MGITEDLKAILQARYGKDVRQSIHDAIKQCYDDGKAGVIDLEARKLLGTTDISGIGDGTATGGIDSLYKNGHAFGICSTARNVVAKVVSCDGFILKTGSNIVIRFTDTGTSNPTSGNITINVNGTGAKQVVDAKSNKTVQTYAQGSNYCNNMVQEFVYDGTYWVWTNRDNNTTYSGGTLKTAAKKTGTAGSSLTTSINASTTIDNAIATLLNNDMTLDSKKLDTNGNSASNTVTFTSNDVADGSATSWTTVEALSSGISHATFFQRVSQMFKNVRYLYKLLGTTDISGIGTGDNKGTVTGIISELNSNFEWKYASVNQSLYAGYEYALPSEIINANEVKIQVGIATLNYTKQTQSIFKGNIAGFNYGTGSDAGYNFVISMYQTSTSIKCTEISVHGWETSLVQLLNIYYR